MKYILICYVPFSSLCGWLLFFMLLASDFKGGINTDLVSHHFHYSYLKITIFQCQNKNNNFGAETISCLKFEVMTGLTDKIRCSIYVCASRKSRSGICLRGVDRLLMNDPNRNIKDIKVSFNNLGKNKEEVRNH